MSKREIERRPISLRVVSGRACGLERPSVWRAVHIDQEAREDEEGLFVPAAFGRTDVWITKDLRDQIVEQAAKKGPVSGSGSNAHQLSA